MPYSMHGQGSYSLVREVILGSVFKELVDSSEAFNHLMCVVQDKAKQHSLTSMSIYFYIERLIELLLLKYHFYN